jgi:hypothetical protein
MSTPPGGMAARRRSALAHIHPFAGKLNPSSEYLPKMLHKYDSNENHYSFDVTQ